MFRPQAIWEWIDDDQTAMCPYCGIDSVIGSASGYPLTRDFLERMASHWFSDARFERVENLRWLLGPVSDEQPYPLLFMTVSGAHLYGFPSADSDYDLRGAHILPLRDVVGLVPGRETIESAGTRTCVFDATSHKRELQLEVDLVTHDMGKFFRLLLKRNGYVLEQLYSPLVLRTTPEHEELKEIARGCVTRHHAHHYLGFARTQWRLFEQDRRVKPLLYVYRALLTGIHLMRTGEVEANLIRLNDVFRLAQADELIAQKLGGSEHGPLQGTDLAFHEREYERLTAELEAAREKSQLPDEPVARDALNNLLIRLRIATDREEDGQ